MNCNEYFVLLPKSISLYSSAYIDEKKMLNNFILPNNAKLWCDSYNVQIEDL